MNFINDNILQSLLKGRKLNDLEKHLGDHLFRRNKKNIQFFRMNRRIEFNELFAGCISRKNKSGERGRQRGKLIGHKRKEGGDNNSNT